MLYSVTGKFAVILVALTSITAPCSVAAADPSPETEIWGKIRTSLFGDRPVTVDNGNVIVLETPYRAEDAATVPIAIRTRVAQSRERFVHKLYLIIDKNPSPIAAVFTFAEMSGRADIETRVRIEEYTHIRAIAEMNNGDLYAVTRYIKAAGGCSAPAGKDAQAALARLGKVRFSVEDALVYGKPVLAQLMISHPNFSGLAMDQATHLYTPPHYVRSVNVTYAGKQLMNADVDFSISENPNFRFYFVPEGSDELEAEIVDSKDLRFKTRLQIGDGAVSRQ
jgi:sulfur-oxidizing protein SoxY